jgi:ABC-type nickel/cobalt efflux system permease component RcnA
MMLGAISVHRVGFGLALVVAFSLGLAGVLSALGLIVVSGRRLFARLPIHRPNLLALPVASALVIVAIGTVLVARAIPPLR